MAAAAVASSASGPHHAKDSVVEAKLNFYLDPSKGGQDEFAIGTAGAYRRKFDERPVQIQNERGREADFNIDIHGFQYVKRVSSKADLTDEDQVKAVAYQEAIQLLKEV